MSIQTKRKIQGTPNVLEKLLYEQVADCLELGRQDI